MRLRWVFVLVCLLILSGVSLVSAQSPDPIIPLSGTWTLTLDDLQNNCPAELTLEEAWMPAPDTQHDFAFSTLENTPFDLHVFVAGDEVFTDPEAYEVTVGDFNQYEIVPAIQTAPYLYRYAVLDEEYILLEYTQTLALSDCALVATYHLAFGGEPVTPESGLYEATVIDLTGSCPASVSVGLSQQGMVEFSALRDATILVMLDESASAPTILYVGEAHGVYVADAPRYDVLTVLSPTAFTLEQTLTDCVMTLDVTRID